ncbi:MAG TPA: hypothetical protein VID70_00495 [Solirubrobacteraceae bacterium]
MQTFFYLLVFGTPLLLIALAILGAHFYRGGDEELLDWKPTRSPETEARLERNDIAQMLDAQNRYRRQRGAPERTLEEALGHPSDGWEL